MTLLTGGFGIALQRLTAPEARLKDSEVWLLVTIITILVFLVALLVVVISTLNVSRGTADDLAFDPERIWERLLSLSAEEVRYDITKLLATACVNSEALLRWKRTWNRRATVALMVQAFAVVVLAVVQAASAA